MTKSTREEAIASLVRETGRPVEYFLGLSPYWFHLLCGWKAKPRMTEEEVDKKNRQMAAMMSTMFGRRSQPSPASPKE